MNLPHASAPGEVTESLEPRPAHSDGYVALTLAEIPG